MLGVLDVSDDDTHLHVGNYYYGADRPPCKVWSLSLSERWYILRKSNTSDLIEEAINGAKLKDKSNIEY